MRREKRRRSICSIYREIYEMHRDSARSKRVEKCVQQRTQFMTNVCPDRQPRYMRERNHVWREEKRERSRVRSCMKRVPKGPACVEREEMAGEREVQERRECRCAVWCSEREERDKEREQMREATCSAVYMYIPNV